MSESETEETRKKLYTNLFCPFSAKIDLKFEPNKKLSEKLWTQKQSKPKKNGMNFWYFCRNWDKCLTSTKNNTLEKNQPLINFLIHFVHGSIARIDFFFVRGKNHVCVIYPEIRNFCAQSTTTRISSSKKVAKLENSIMYRWCLCNVVSILCAFFLMIFSFIFFRYPTFVYGTWQDLCHWNKFVSVSRDVLFIGENW